MIRQSEASSPGDTVLEVIDLRVEIADDGRAWEVVRGVSLSLRRGRILGLVGESGSGKSMTARAIMQLLPPAARLTSGAIRLGDDNTVEMTARQLRDTRGRRIALVAQDPMTSLNPLLRIGRQVAEPLRLHKQASRREGAHRAREQLAAVGMADPAGDARKYPHECSGGMRQRALIAGALITTPEVLIADEPTTALDVTIQAQVLRLIRELAVGSGAGALLISHDLAVIAETADEVSVMYAGRIVESGPAAAVLTGPRHPYTAALIDALPPDPGGDRRRLRALGGEAPDPRRLDTGCDFASRCSYAEQRCREQAPPLADVTVAPPGAPREVACWRHEELHQLGQPAAVHPAKPPARVGERVPVPAPAAAAGSAPGGEPVLEVRGVTCTYRPRQGGGFRRTPVTAVDGVSLAIAQGEVLGLVGESGSGKSTLARAILQMPPPAAGQILFRGEDLASLSRSVLRVRRRKFQPIFQDPYSSLNPRLPVRDIVGEPLAVAGQRGKDAEDAVAEALERVGLGAAFAGRLPSQLSGGQRQRAAIARAIVSRPDLLVADEPLSSLDVSIQAQVLNLLTDLRDELGLSMLFVSHDMRVVEYFSDRIAVMFRGGIVETGPAGLVCRGPQHPYTVSLIQSVPRLGAESGNAAAPPGGATADTQAAAPLTELHAGCRFRRRCPIARDICSAEAPPLADAGDGRQVACHFPGTLPVRGGSTPLSGSRQA